MSHSPKWIKQDGSPTTRSQAFETKDFAQGLALNPPSKDDLQTIKMIDDESKLSFQQSTVQLTPILIHGNGNLKSLKVEVTGLNLDLPTAVFNPNDTMNTLVDSAVKESTFR